MSCVVSVVGGGPGMIGTAGAPFGNVPFIATHGLPAASVTADGVGVVVPDAALVGEAVDPAVTFTFFGLLLLFWITSTIATATTNPTPITTPATHFMRRVRAALRARSTARRSFCRSWAARACLEGGIAATLSAVTTVDEARTAVDLLRRVAATYGDRDAYVEPDRRLTFAQWDRAADGLAAHFLAAGVTPGRVVALILPSSMDYAICYQAVMRLRAITSGINPRLGPTEVASILERTKPAVVVREEDLPFVRDAYARAAPKLPRVEPNDPVAIVWTSGTTGMPKGAVFDHDNLAAVGIGAGAMGEPFDVRLTPLPFAHVGYMTRPFEEIGKFITNVVPATPWKAGDALALMARERVTVGQGVPTQWRLVLDHPDFDATDLSSLRIAGTGASTVAPDLIREMETRLGCPVVIG